MKKIRKAKENSEMRTVPQAKKKTVRDRRKVRMTLKERVLLDLELKEKLWMKKVLCLDRMVKQNKEMKKGL